MIPFYYYKDYLDPEHILTFEFQKNREEVFDAWMDKEKLAEWFRPDGFTTALCEVDARPDGYFKVHMQAPDGTIYPTMGEFIILEGPDRIVYKDSWDDDRINNEPIVTEIRFKENNTGCTLELYSCFPTPERRQETITPELIEGWKGFFKNLDEM